MNKNFHHKAQMVADGHKTETLASITNSLVVSCDSVRIALTIAALNKLKIQACDIQNNYLTVPCQEKFWMITRSEFGFNKGKQTLVVWQRFARSWQKHCTAPDTDHCTQTLMYG